eukprot:8768713-Ditylum_brightwellii.AAC.1
MQSLLQVMQAMQSVYAPKEECSFPYCSCHKITRSGLDSSLKACAACGAASYCCKKSQTSDWRRHKKLCLGLRHFKDSVNHLTTQQKISLNSISLELPPIAEEYQKKYGSGSSIKVHLLYIHGALAATKDMVNKNISNLASDSADTWQDTLKRWQEISPDLSKFIDSAKPGDIYLGKKYSPYEPGAPQQFRNTPSPHPAVLKNGTT